MEVGEGVFENTGGGCVSDSVGMEKLCLLVEVGDRVREVNPISVTPVFLSLKNMLENGTVRGRGLRFKLGRESCYSSIILVLLGRSNTCLAQFVGSCVSWWILESKEKSLTSP